jgi:hypothetical protein
LINATATAKSESKRTQRTTLPSEKLNMSNLPTSLRIG